MIPGVGETDSDMVVVGFPEKAGGQPILRNRNERITEQKLHVAALGGLPFPSTFKSRLIGSVAFKRFDQGIKPQRVRRIRATPPRIGQSNFTQSAAAAEFHPGGKTL